MKNVYCYAIATAIAICFSTCATAQINFSGTPVWFAHPGAYPTGLGWTDLNGDGHLDLVVSNGLDVSNAPVTAYYNDEGVLPASASWTSSELAPHDCIYTGDLNNDGYPDLVASKLGITNTGLPPLHHTIYYNEGSGLSTSPGWYSPMGNGFSCTGGDVDGDGDIDLVFGQGDWLTQHPQKTKLFINNNGIFDTIPGWESDSTYFVDEVVMADVDNDGDHDLAIGNERTVGNVGIAIFYNNGGTLETTPSWYTDSIIGGRQMAFGDVDFDGDLDLAVASPTERFYLFRNNDGILEDTACWMSPEVNEPATVSWADADGDGDLDLATGSWFSAVAIYENIGGILQDTAAWKKSMGTGTQQIAWADYDEDNLIDSTYTAVGDGSRKLFYLGVKNLQGISSVAVNGSKLPLVQYCADLTEGWISLASAPFTGEILMVSYTYSNDLDITVTNWSQVKIYENLNVITGLNEQKGNFNDTRLRLSYPNPFRNSTVIEYFLRQSSFVTLKIYDITGKEIAALVEESMPSGQYSQSFDAIDLPGGIYTCLLKAGDYVDAIKLICIND